MKKHLKFSIGLLILLFVSFVFGANSPSEIWDFNSRAKEILVGNVLNIALTPDSWNLTVNNYSESKYFELEIKQVRKTSSNLTERRIIKIPFYRFLLPVSGGKEVLVNKGELIKIYANPSVIGKDIFELAISGDSVVHLKNLSDLNIEEASKDCFVYRGTLLIRFKENITEKEKSDILRKQNPPDTSSGINGSFNYVYFERNSSYSDLRKYIDAYEKEDAIEYVEFYSHNGSCYPGEMEIKISEERDLNIFQKILRWILNLF